MTDNKPKIVGYIAESDLGDLENEECHIGPVCIASDSWPGTVALIRLSDYEARIAILFDGHAVYNAMTDKAKQHTSPESVAAVLDAVVKLIREVRHD